MQIDLIFPLVQRNGPGGLPQFHAAEQSTNNEKQSRVEPRDRPPDQSLAEVCDHSWTPATRSLGKLSHPVFATKSQVLQKNGELINCQQHKQCASFFVGSIER